MATVKLSNGIDVNLPDNVIGTLVPDAEKQAFIDSMITKYDLPSNLKFRDVDLFKGTLPTSFMADYQAGRKEKVFLAEIREVRPSERKDADGNPLQSSCTAVIEDPDAGDLNGKSYDFPLAEEYATVGRVVRLQVRKVGDVIPYVIVGRDHPRAGETVEDFFEIVRVPAGRPRGQKSYTPQEIAAERAALRTGGLARLKKDEDALVEEELIRQAQQDGDKDNRKRLVAGLKDGSITFGSSFEEYLKEKGARKVSVEADSAL